jgi:uncharacterized protein (DUF1015 family)
MIYDFLDERSIKNRFYRMTSQEDMARLAALMEAKSVYIADGHHRLDVSYRLNLQYIPLYLTNMYSPGIVILPYHRIIKFKKQRSLAELVASLDGLVEVEKEPFVDDESPKKVAQRINASSKPSFILYSKDDPLNFYILTVHNHVYADPAVHDTLRKLKVSILHSGILKNIFHIEDEEISFTQDLYKSIKHVKEGSIDMAVFLPPTSVEEVKEVAEHGLYMPPKSTFFYPKILTGLVFHKYE